MPNSESEVQHNQIVSTKYNFIICDEISKLITIWNKFPMFHSESTQTQATEFLDISPGFPCLKRIEEHHTGLQIVSFKKKKHFSKRKILPVKFC